MWLVTTILKLGLNVLKFTVAFLLNLNHATFEAFTIKKTAVVSVILTVSNLVRFKTVCEELLLSEQSGHSLVRGLSDILNSLTGFLIATFILKNYREHSQNLDKLFKLNESIQFPTKMYLLAFLLQSLVFSLNVLPFIVEKNQIVYYLSCITTDIFIISMDIQVIFVQYIIFTCFRALNIKIATQALNDQSVAQLRLSHSNIFSISEKFHQIYSAVSLALFATHSFYLQIDLFYLISSLYNLQVVQDVTLVGDKKFIVEYILWSFVNCTSIIIIFLGYSKVEIEVILLSNLDSYNQTIQESNYFQHI
jgi:hypothetical protein